MHPGKAQITNTRHPKVVLTADYIVTLLPGRLDGSASPVGGFDQSAVNMSVVFVKICTASFSLKNCLHFMGHRLQISRGSPKEAVQEDLPN